jgi:predicted nucleotidyltransferase
MGEQKDVGLKSLSTNRKIYYKGMFRIQHTPPNTIYDLPENITKELLKIKNIILDFYKENVNIYLYGSYSSGMYNENSDIDIIINRDENLEILRTLLKEKISIKIDIFCNKNELKLIKI